MWVKKTEEEIKDFDTKPKHLAGIRDSSLKYAIFIFVFSTILQILGDLILGKSKGRFYLPSDYVREKVQLSDLPDLLPSYLVVSLVLAIFVWMLLKRIGKDERLNSKYLCQKCYKVKKADKTYKCECGGEYIEIEKMKWIEEEEDE